MNLFQELLNYIIKCSHSNNPTVRTVICYSNFYHCWDTITDSYNLKRSLFLIRVSDSKAETPWSKDLAKKSCSYHIVRKLRAKWAAREGDINLQVSSPVIHLQPGTTWTRRFLLDTKKLKLDYEVWICEVHFTSTFLYEILLTRRHSFQCMTIYQEGITYKEKMWVLTIPGICRCLHCELLVFVNVKSKFLLSKCHSV